MNIEDTPFLAFLQKRLPLAIFSTGEIPPPDPPDPNIVPLEIIIIDYPVSFVPSTLAALVVDYHLQCGYNISVRHTDPALFKHVWEHLPQLPSRFSINGRREKEAMVCVIHAEGRKAMISIGGALDVGAAKET